MNRDTAAKKIMRESLGGTGSREKLVRLYTADVLELRHFCLVQWPKFFSFETVIGQSHRITANSIPEIIPLSLSTIYVIIG